MDHAIDILLNELIADEEFRHSFLRRPRGTLRTAADWGVPLSDSEISALICAAPALWDHVAEQLIERLQYAA